MRASCWRWASPTPLFSVPPPPCGPPAPQYHHDSDRMCDMDRAAAGILARARTRALIAPACSRPGYPNGYLTYAHIRCVRTRASCAVRMLRPRLDNLKRRSP